MTGEEGNEVGDKMQMRQLRWFRGSLLGLVILSCASSSHGAERAVSEPSALPRYTSADWPWWRGPQRNGVADAQQKPLLKWSSTENVLWKTPIHGKGHGTPTLLGNRVYVASSDLEQKTQFVLCFDRATGKPLWEKVVHRDGLDPKGNKRSSLASGSVACDGTRVIINFFNAGHIWVTALDQESGDQLWQTKVTDFAVHQGYGPSPSIYQSLVIVSADSKGTGMIAGLDRATGKIIWKHLRPKSHNYTSPIILNAAGKDQVFCIGCEVVTSLDPLTGQKNWEIPGATAECVTSTVTDGTHIFSSGGYPRNHLAAIRADGSGKIAWENNTRVYVPSMLVHDGNLYATLDAGVACCWNAATGKELWKKRVGGDFSASPVLLGDLIYATNETGKTTIFKANPRKFELVAENQLGEEAYATMVLLEGRIYTRVAEQLTGKRQEVLYCLGEK